MRWLGIATACAACTPSYAVRTLQTPRIKGADVLVLVRRKTDPPPSSSVIERVIVLPGQGFSILQITAYVPGHGDVDLLKAPDLAEAARIYRDTPADRKRTTN